MRHMTQADKDTLILMWMRGEKVDVIAAVIGFSRKTVIQKRADLKLPARCQRNGVPKGPFNMMLELPTVDAAKKVATRRRMSFSAYVTEALKRAVEAEK